MTLLALLVGLVAGASVATVVVRRRRLTSRPTAPSTTPPPEVEPVPTALRDAVDALPIGVVVSLPRSGIVFRNAVARGSTGTLHADVLVDEAVETHLRRAADGGVRERQVLDLFGPPRTVVVVEASPLPGGGAVATIEDITERSRLDAVRTDFVANVSHELKTPIGAIAVLAEALQDEDDPDVVRRFATRMVTEAHRLGTTIDDLLELSRIELGGQAMRQAVGARAVVEQAVDRVRDLAASRGIDITVDVAAPEPALWGDARQLASALGNLVENAVKYSGDGARVRIAARTADHGGAQVVDVTVADSGPGIPSRDLDRIFERFYRVDRARSRDTGGTGLGLSIVRHVATNHGGEVLVTSREGEGSTFTLRIPAVPSPTRSDDPGVATTVPSAQEDLT